MEQIWVGMHSIKESLRLLETNAAEEDWDTRYWTWVDREILSEAAALAEETDQDVELAAAQDPAGPAVEVPVSQDPGAALSVEADVHSGPGPGSALAAELIVPAAAVEAAPDPDHGLPVDRGPDDAGDVIPAPFLTPMEVESSGSEEGIRRKEDVYADNVTVA